MRAVLAFAVTIAVMGCGRGGDGAEPGANQPSGDTPTPVAQPAPVDPNAPQVVLTSDRGVELAVAVEIVRTPEARRRGLMFRQHLPPNRGMLFLFDREEVQSFWMRNTLIPLDMLFIDRELTVVGIVENAAPRTDTPRHVGKPSIYVLEVNGGWTRANAVAAGSKVRFENVEP